MPLQVVFSLLTTRLVVEAIGDVEWGAYRFAWGFGFFQFLFEFGVSSALQRQISDAWTRGDREAVDRSIACGMTFYTGVAVLQIAALLGVAYCALPSTAFTGSSYHLIVRLLWLQIASLAPCYGYSVVVSSACFRPPAGTTLYRGSSCSAPSRGSWSSPSASNRESTFSSWSSRRPCSKSA